MSKMLFRWYMFYKRSSFVIYSLDFLYTSVQIQNKTKLSPSVLLKKNIRLLLINIISLKCNIIKSQNRQQT